MNPWIEAARPRTLPAGACGVIAAAAAAIAAGCFQWLPVLLSLAFAMLAQIASNFANEYFDWRSGVDTPGREGFRRGVTEGDIAPQAMLRATQITLAAACCCALPLILWSGWWLIIVGAVTAIAVIAYSAGPWPLSRHGLGEAAVIVFYGLEPVIMVWWFQAHRWSWPVLMLALGIGLLTANIMLVNNTRDIDTDRAVGKHTLAVILRRRAMPWVYGLNAAAGIALVIPLAIMWIGNPWRWLWLVTAYAALQAAIIFARRLSRQTGRQLNLLLRNTSLLALAITLTLLLAAILGR